MYCARDFNRVADDEFSRNLAQISRGFVSGAIDLCCFILDGENDMAERDDARVLGNGAFGDD